MYTYKGKAIDIIEYFGEHIVVQIICTQEILTLKWQDLDSLDKIEYTLPSNVFSLDWYRKNKHKNKRRR